jgi:preprotein translocase subunit Sec61beta
VEITPGVVMVIAILVAIVVAIAVGFLASP